MDDSFGGFMSLGKWAVIDLETTGVNPLDDQIIDVGYYQFDGLKLVKEFASLVRYTGQLSQFIQKLTGIKPSQLKKAPRLEEIEDELFQLAGHTLLAHNANFERGFLKGHFEMGVDDQPEYTDSLDLLPLINVKRSSFSLESFIQDWSLSDHEEHRGLADSRDLLKVLILEVLAAKKNIELDLTRKSIIEKYQLHEEWWAKFYQLESDDLYELARQINFEPDKYSKDVAKEDERFATRKISYEFSGENIKELLSDETNIQKIIPHYKKRDPQIELALRTGQSFKNKIHAMVQAPTGTGKTLGYMIPAALFSLEEKKQVLISTGTKTLQNQAIQKDVPQLRKMLGLPESNFRVSRLQGSSNHLCELMFRNDTQEVDLLSLTKDKGEALGRAYFEMLFATNALTSKANDKAMRGDIPYIFKRNSASFREMERQWSVDFRTCTGPRCPFVSSCSYIQGLREAKEANVIIGNHALTFAWPRGFPRPEYVVVDEAHKLESEATSAFTKMVSEELLESFYRSLLQGRGLGALYFLLSRKGEENDTAPEKVTEEINRLRDMATRTAASMKDHMAILPEVMERCFKKSQRYTSLYWNERPMIRKEDSSSEDEVAIFNHLESLFNIIKILYAELLPQMIDKESQDLSEDSLSALVKFEAFMAQMEDMLAAFAAAFSLELKDGHVVSLRYHEDYGWALETAPLDVGKEVHNKLMETSASVVFTSATLANADGSQGIQGVEWMTGYTYLKPERRFKKGFFLPAVYDYKNKSKVFLCDDQLPFRDSQFVPSVLIPINKLIKKIGGRSLLLFSAKTRFEAAREILIREFEGQMPLFIQGMGNDIVEDFKKAGSGILLGMESLGEGIDIPGDSLQFVFIDKIPDLRQDLIIQERRKFYQQTFGNEFNDYFLANRTRMLHQKLGRLLRTEHDFGGAIVVDSRIKNWKPYTVKTLSQLMEPYALERCGLNEACDKITEYLN